MKDTYSNSDLLSKEEIKRILGDERDCDCCDNVIFFRRIKEHFDTYQRRMDGKERLEEDWENNEFGFNLRLFGGVLNTVYTHFDRKKCREK